mgnify:CR=1 FL=1
MEGDIKSVLKDINELVSQLKTICENNYEIEYNKYVEFLEIMENWALVTNFSRLDGKLKILRIYEDAGKNTCKTNVLHVSRVYYLKAGDNHLFSALDKDFFMHDFSDETIVDLLQIPLDIRHKLLDSLKVSFESYKKRLSEYLEENSILK